MWALDASLAAAAVARMPPMPGAANSRPVASMPMPSDSSEIGPNSTISWPNVKLNAIVRPTRSTASFEPLIARAPATMRDRSPASTSTSPTLPRTFIRHTSSAEKRKVRALRANATGGGPSSNSTAESAGPNAIAKLSIVPAKAFAAARSSSGTIEGVIAVTAG